MKRAGTLLLIPAVLYVAALVLIEAAASTIAMPALSLSSGERNVPVVAVTFYTDTVQERQERVAAAVALHRSGHVTALVMTGGDRPERAGYRGSKLMAAEAQSQGVDADKVVADAGSNDSVSNLESAMRAIAETFGSSVRMILVSDRLHLLRLSWIARKLEVKLPVTLVPAGHLPSGLRRLQRLNHEVLAYLSLLLPRGWVRSILATTRRI